MEQDRICVVVRGGGDIATGTIHRLWNAGYRVVILETEKPSAIRRQVALCEAVYDGESTVEGATAQIIKKTNIETINIKKINIETTNIETTNIEKIDIENKCVEEIKGLWSQNKIPLIIDPQGQFIKMIKPSVVVDAILAKKNLGMYKGMAPLTIGLGPGFVAGEDVDVVIETMRGNTLGDIIEEGSAIANTGIPGNVGGYTKERVIHAKETGIIHAISHIGDRVEQGQCIVKIEHTNLENESSFIEVYATITGVLRGLIREGFMVKKGCKIADIDPRIEEEIACDKISDKAHCIAESVLQVIKKYQEQKC